MAKNLLLAIDIGNTTVALGVFRGKRLIRHGKVPTHCFATKRLWKRALGEWFRKQKISPRQIATCILCSVVPKSLELIQSALKELLDGGSHAERGNQKLLLIVGRDIKVPMPNRYKNPRQVGQDRLVNAYAGFTQYGGPLILADFGTAVTFDIVSKKGEYLGGLIIPGLEIARDVLAQRTALLPKVKISAAKRIIGKTTQESIQSGLFYGWGALTDGVVAKIKKEIGPAKVIATGGQAELIVPFLKSIDKVNPHLTLQGLFLLVKQGLFLIIINLFLLSLSFGSTTSLTFKTKQTLAPAATIPKSIIERQGISRRKKPIIFSSDSFYRKRYLLPMVGDRGPKPEGSGKAIWFWNIATRQFVGEGLNLPKGKEDPIGVIWDISMAERGERLAALMSSGTVLTWALQETKTGELIGKHPHPQFLDHPFSRVESLAVSPDGRFIALSGLLVSRAGMTAERKIRVWELVTDKVTGSITYHKIHEVTNGHSSGQGKLAFSPDGKLVSVDHHMIRLWNLPDLKPLASIPYEFTDGTKNLSISEDGRFLMVESAQNHLQFVSLSDLTISDAELNESTDTIVTLAFGPDRSLSFMSQGQNARVMPYRKLVTGTILDIPYLKRALLSPDGLHVAKISKSGLEQYVTVWEISQDSPEGIVDDHLGTLRWVSPPLVAPVGSGVITTISFAPDGKFIAVGTSVGEASIWDLQDLNGPIEFPRWGLKDMGYGIRSIAISKNADLLVTCDFEKGIIEVFDVKKISPHYVVAKPIQTLKPPKPTPDKPNTKVRRLAISPDGRFVFGVFDDGRVRFWDRERGTDVAGEELIVSGELPYNVTEALGEMTSLAFSSDGTQLAVGGKGKIQIWYLQENEATGEEVFRLLQSITLYEENVMSITSKPPGAQRSDTLWLLESSFVSRLHSYHDDLAMMSSSL